MADSINAVCVESNCFAADLFNTPSPLHDYTFSNKSLAALASKGTKQNLNFKEFLAACKRESIHPELRYSFKRLPKGLEHLFFLQAFDIFTGFLKALDVLKNNDITPARTVAAGYSHGGNMVHICNAMWPGFFSVVVDDSSLIDWNFIKIPRKSSVKMDGVATTFIHEFSKWANVLEPDLYYPEKLYSETHGGLPPSPIFFFATEEDVIAGAKEKENIWANRKGCHVFVANRKNLYLDGLYNSGGHADSDRAALIQKALELTPSPNGAAKAKVPDGIQFKTQNYIYTVDHPFTGEEAVSIKPLKGE
ncbi:MAG: hypothetical protein JEZ02_17125 [Desulfatibacillum sp.]|nr:hypothetical protein [Desulfatibacillum sp.]